MAEECSQHITKHKFASPAELLNHLAWLKDQVATKSLSLIEGSLPLDETLKTGQPHDDTEAWVFECSRCRARFQLYIDNYHGGASWEHLAPSKDSYFDFLRNVEACQQSRISLADNL